MRVKIGNQLKRAMQNASTSGSHVIVFMKKNDIYEKSDTKRDQISIP